jgi:hypothetical protein
LAGTAGLLPPGLGRAAQMLAAGVLLLHALELIFVFDRVRRYRGALGVSVLLTLLFGLLHWKRLADAAEQRASGSSP